MPETVALTIDGRASSARRGDHGGRRARERRRARLPDVRRGRAARRPLRDGHLLRVPRHDRRRPAPARVHGDRARRDARRDGAGASAVRGPAAAGGDGGARVRRRRRRRGAGGRRGGVPRGRERARGRSCSTRGSRRAGRSTGTSPGAAAPDAARPWLERLARSGAAVRFGAAVFDAVARGRGWKLSAETAAGLCVVRARRVVLATGARELFLPFPGWTLPGVMGAGGAQALGKSGASLAGRTAVVAGSGPLLLPVAASLAKAGADVALVAEQAGLAVARALRRGARRLSRQASRGGAVSLGLLRHAVPDGNLGGGGARPRPARERRPDRRRASASRSPATSRRSATASCRTRSSRACSAARARAGAVVVDERQETSVAGVFCAGEPCGVAGVDVAIAEGEIAGLAAAGGLADAAGSRRAGGRARCAAGASPRRWTRAFRPRPRAGGAGAARHDRLPLRGRAFASLAACASAREAKLSSRAGHGAVPGPRLRPGARVSLRLGFGYRTPAGQAGARSAVSSARNKERA